MKAGSMACLIRNSLLLLLAFSTPGFGQMVPEEDVRAIEAFMVKVKSGDARALARTVVYPLRRGYPLPDIADSAEFASKFDLVFDDYLRNAVSASAISDWSRVGFRGIMLHHGIIWLDLDGNLLAVNYLSPEELLLKERLIEEGRAAVHQSLKNYEAPSCVAITSARILRIDRLATNSYRLAIWNAGSPMSDAPHTVVESGAMTVEGRNGDHLYRFEQGNTIYEVFAYRDEEAGSDLATLTVLKEGKEILYDTGFYTGE